MPPQDYMQILSVDDDLIERSRVFVDRLRSKYSAKMPHRGNQHPQASRLWANR
jgi:hypothetical protein